MRGRGVDDPHLATLGQRYRFTCGIVRQAQHCEIGGAEGIAPGAGVLALLLVEQDQFEFGARGEPFDDLEPGGAGGAVDEDLAAHGSSTSIGK